MNGTPPLTNDHPQFDVAEELHQLLRGVHRFAYAAGV